MPFIDLAFRVKPVGQVTAGFATTVMPQFIRPLGDLFFQVAVQIDVKNWLGNFWRCCFFHKSGDGTML